MSRRLSRTDPKTGQRTRKRQPVDRGIATPPRPGSLQGLAGQRPADEMERAMRAARRRARRQHARDLPLSRGEHRKAAAVANGVQMRDALGKRVGADKEPKAARAGWKRAQKRSQGPSHTERWIPGPSENWTKAAA